jgi:hypothetical protein
MATNLQRGIYETEDGNAAYVSGPKAKTAYDLDAGESIPIQLVTTKWLRAAEPADKARKGNCYDLKRSIW